MLKYMQTLAGRALAVLAVTGALAAGAFADVTPSEGTIGTEFTATFDGDLGKKPKIELRYLEPTAKSPKAKAKVTSINGGTVTFVIQAAKGGGDFSVSVKGSDEQAGTLALRAPRADSADSATVAAGSELVFTGAFFGDDSNKRNAPKVFVNGKKAKTRAYTSTTLTVQVHKKTDAGLANITIQNKIGESTFNGVVTVTAPVKPIKGGDFVNMLVNGKKVNTTTKAPGAVAASLVVNQLQITVSNVAGKDPRKGIRTILMALRFELPTSFENLQLPVVINPVGLVTYSDSLIRGTTSDTSAYAGNAPHNIVLTIDSREGDRISGTFSGTMDKETGNGPNVLNITKGLFVLTAR